MDRSPTRTATTLDTTQRPRIVHIATIGEMLGAIMSGENAKNAANANGVGTKGGTMIAGIETAGATAMTGTASPAGSWRG